MAWAVPITFTTGALAAADLNAMLRDNMNETMPAKATIPGSYFVGTGINTIAQRQVAADVVLTSETRTLASYGDLATPGPAVTVTTGTRVIVVVTAQVSNNTLNGVAQASYAISGATTTAASGAYSLDFQNAGSSQHMAASHVSWQQVNAGSNTFTMKYQTQSGGTSTFLRRRILVFPL